MQKYKFFLIKVPIFLAIFCIGYVAFTHLFIRISSAHHYSFKDYLITHTTGQNRIIIESGSNSYHGINSTMIEKHFNKLTINLADHGGYPLLHKLHRLSQFAHAGDVIIMPLEYRFYIGDVPPDTYYKGVFFELHHYYDYLPRTEKIKFILQILPASFVQAAIRDYREYGAFRINFDNYINSKPQAVYDFAPHLARGERGDYEYVGKVAEAKDTKMPCQTYIFFTGFNNEPIGINQIFKDNLKFMQKLAKEKGLKFIFTYPSITGDDCYSASDPRNAGNMKFLADVRKLIEQSGFEFIGDYRDSYFERKFLHDTWFHLVPEARDIRTRRLIENLERSKFAEILREGGYK